MPSKINNRTKKSWKLKHPPELHPEAQPHATAGELMDSYNTVGKLDIAGFISVIWLLSFINFIKKSEITGPEFRCLMFTGKLKVDSEKNVPTLKKKL